MGSLTRHQVLRRHRMSMTTDQIIKTYKAAQEWLSTPGRKVNLVGAATYARACPQCRKQISKGATVINAGEAKGRWSWICPACAPEDPSTLPHIDNLLDLAVRTPNHALLKKTFWQELDQRAKELGAGSGRDLTTHTTLLKMKQTQTPELAECQPVIQGEQGLGVTAPPGKEEAAATWVRAAYQAVLDELTTMLKMPFRITALAAYIATREEVFQDQGSTPEVATKAPLAPPGYVCPDVACMNQHLQLMQDNFDTPEVFVPMIDQLRMDLGGKTDPADYYWNAGLALSMGTKFFITPVESRAYTDLANYLEGTVSLTAELFPAPAGVCWLAEANARLTPGETIRAISWTLTRTASSDRGDRLMLVPISPEELPKSKATGVWVHLWHDSNNYEAIFGLFPLPRTILWHMFTAADLKEGGAQAAVELSWLAAFLAQSSKL
jgi:hypothetical protein